MLGVRSVHAQQKFPNGVQYGWLYVWEVGGGGGHGRPNNPHKVGAHILHSTRKHNSRQQDFGRFLSDEDGMMAWPQMVSEDGISMKRIGRVSK